MNKKTTIRTVAAFMLAALFASLFTACSDETEQPPPPNLTGTYADYIDSGTRFAVQLGDVYGDVARNLFIAKEVQEYTKVADMLESLHLGRIDAMLIDATYVKPLEESGSYTDIDFLWVPKDVFVNERASIFHTEELRDKYDEWLVGIKADGTLDEITDRWIGVPLPTDEDIPRFELTGENGTLRVCDTGDYPPFTYYDGNGELVGFDTELAFRFAEHLGMTLEVSIMSYDAVLPYVISGRADMSACNYTVTDERKESMLFGEPCIVSQGVVVVPKGASASAGTASADASAKARDYTDFAGKDIAVLTGVLTYNTTERIGANPVLYNDSASAAEEVRQGRVDGYMHALTAVQVMAAQLDGFEAIPVPKEIFSAQIGGISEDQAVIDRFDTFLAAIAADGTLNEMQRRWFSDALDLDAPMPDIPNSGTNGVLRVAICSDSIPYVYVGADGQYSGFSTELALRFGAYEGKTVEFADMEFGGLIPYIVSQRADIALANMAITEERKESVLFTEPFFDEQHGILALKQGGEAAAEPTAELTYADFEGKRIGMRTGAAWDIVIAQIGGTPAYFSDMSAGVEDIRMGRLDGFITDLSATRVFVATEQGRDFVSVEIPAEIFNAPMGAMSMNQDMIDKLNEFLALIKATGIHDDMQERWLKNVPDLDAPMPDIDLTGGSGTLTVATSSASLPFAYVGDNGEYKGFSIEIALRFAQYAGFAAINYADMEFAALIPYVVSGKADFAIADVSITEERAKSVIFTDSIYDDQGGIVALKQGSAADAVGDAPEMGGGFIDWLKIGIERNLLTDSRWKMIVDGLGVTMTISVFAQLFGTALACFICWVLMRKNRFANWFGRFYCGLIHGTPVVVLLMITYYIIFGSTTISNVVIAIAAFTLVMGANVAQNLKGAIDTVDPVEIEAARSIGFPAWRAFLSVTLPQAVKRALPGYTNGFVELVKATAIVGYIAIQDLTRAADIIRSRTYDAYFPLLLVAVIYLIVTTICVQLFKYIVKKVNGGVSE